MRFGFQVQAKITNETFNDGTSQKSSATDLPLLLVPQILVKLQSLVEGRPSIKQAPGCRRAQSPSECT